MPFHAGNRPSKGERYSPPVVADPFFNQTTLLLNGNGTNGAQNNTFLDGSTNNFTITRNGNTTQGTFTPFSQPADYWSNFFDGNEDYFNVANTSIGSLSGNSFTIECSIFLTAYAVPSTGLYTSALFSSHSTSSFNGFEFYVKGTASSWTTVGVYATTAGTIDREFGFTFSLNTWYHIALTRTSGGTFVIYVNGTSIGTFTNTASWTDFSPYGIAHSNLTGYRYFFPGYISNYRLVIGSVVYSSNFTPPTTPLTAITNTKLLTCQSNRFVDNSTLNNTLTRFGDVRVTPFSPFAPTAAYSASVNGGSGYFDGTGDYLSYSEFSSATDFTAECWFYRTATGTVRHNLFSTINAGDGNTNRNCQLAVGTDGSIFVALNNAAVSEFNSVGGNVVPIGTWNHIVYVRSGTNLSVFVNGTRIANGTSSATLFLSSVGTSIYNSVASSFVNGYISNSRITNTVVYDPSASTITVPTAPLTAVTGTHALLNFTNAGIIDSTGKNVLETIADAQIDTTIKKYGTGSIKFDGSGDYLNIPLTPEYNFGNGDFTVELWINSPGISSQGILAFPHNSGNYAPILLFGATSTRIDFYSSSAGTSWNVASGAVVGTITVNTWHHVAISKQGSSIRLFFDGTLTGTTTFSGTFTGTYDRVWIGDTSANSNFNGYIDDLRITKGVARYTTNFTPPAQEFIGR